MLSFIVIQVLIWPSPTFAILSLTSNPVFTMESLNGTETEEPKQAFTVPLDVDLETIETDPVTDGGTQLNSQSAITSTVTPVLSDVTDGGEDNIKLYTMNIDPKETITLNLFNTTSTEDSAPAVGSMSKETADNGTFIPLQDTNKGQPFDEQLEPFLEIPMENSTEGKQCFCNIPGPTGQKGDKGDRGDPGEPGKVGKRGPQGYEGAKGKKGLSGVKGETGSKGDKGDIGPKGDPGDSCALCEKGERGEQGVPGNNGAAGLQGIKGEPGNKGMKGDMGPKGYQGERGSNGIDGIPGAPGEVGPIGAMGPRGPVGPKGDQGMLGPMGKPGYRGPAGIPGKKGEKGQKGAQSDHENIAFSVGVRGQGKVVLPGQPIRFDRVFINENNPYSVNSGIFVANIEGVYYFTYHISLSSRLPFRIGLVHNAMIVIQTQARQCERNVCQAAGSVLLHLREDDEIWLQVLSSAQNELISDESDSLFTGFILYSLED